MLYPAYLCDTLLRLAEAGSYRPMWSADVLAELRRNLIEEGLAADKVDYRIGQMRETFPGAAVAGYESLIEAMTNDPKDRHVLAAAVRANAEVIVTFNTSDFPEHALHLASLTAARILTRTGASFAAGMTHRIGHPHAFVQVWSRRLCETQTYRFEPYRSSLLPRGQAHCVSALRRHGDGMECTVLNYVRPLHARDGMGY